MDRELKTEGARGERDGNRRNGYAVVDTADCLDPTGIDDFRFSGFGQKSESEWPEMDVGSDHRLDQYHRSDCLLRHREA